MSGSINNYSREVRGEIRHVKFAGLNCLAIDVPYLGVAVCLPGEPPYRLSGNPSSMAWKGEFMCGGRTAWPHAPTRVMFISQGQTITFPFVLNGADPRHSWVIDDAALLPKSEAGPDAADLYWLRYRVTCPKCREASEYTASRIFDEVRRKKAEEEATGAASR